MQAIWQVALPPIAVAVVAALGCSSSSAGPGGGGDDGGVDATGAPPPDAAGDAPLNLDAGSCKPASVASFQPPPYTHASGAFQDQCTSAMIDQFYDACFGPNQSETACAAFQPDADATRAACAACIVTPQTASTYGAVVLYTSISIGIPNVAGCIELLDPTSSGLACAKSVQADDDCDLAACAANCPLSTPGGVQAFESCTVAADSDGCKAYADPANACLGADADAAASACPKLGFHDLAMLFCGPAPTPDAGSD
jgi:hypothetical protein